jgi:hypothetical protein
MALDALLDEAPSVQDSVEHHHFLNHWSVIGVLFAVLRAGHA